MLDRDAILKAAREKRKEIESQQRDLGGLREIGKAIINMWDALPDLSRTTITKLLPNLAERLNELRDHLGGDDA